MVILNVGKIFADGFDAFAKLIAAQQLIKDAGVQAIIFPDGTPNNVFNAFSLNWGTQLSPLPVAQLGGEDAKLVSRLLEKGPVTIEFQYENRVTGPLQFNNVVAEIPGRERLDEWIIIGAHLDS